MESDRQWSNTLRYAAIFGLIILLILLIYIAKPTINLILFAAVIAYILTPTAKFLQKRLHLKRKYAILLSYLLLLLTVVLIFALVIPVVTDYVYSFINQDWPYVIDQIDGLLEELIRELEMRVITIGGYEINLTIPLIELRNSIASLGKTNVNIDNLLPNVTKALTSIISVSANVAASVGGAIVATLTTFMASVHFCNDGHRLKGWFINLFAKPYQREINELFHRLGQVWNNYFVGELKLMGFIGCLTTIVCAILGLRWALLLGLVAGFCEIVPNIGPILSAVPAIIVALIFGSTYLPFSNFIMAIIVIAAYILIQQAENILIVPRLMGNALNLHPVVIILGILILSTRLGILGALLAAPLIGLIKVVFYFILHKIRGEDPFPEIYATALESDVDIQTEA